MLHIPPKDMSFKAVRARLRNPPNAVPDLGIDLRRKDEPEPVEPQIEAPTMQAVKVDGTDILPAPTRDCSILPSSPAMRDIISRVCSYYGMTREQLLLPRRIAGLVWRRSIAMYFCRRVTKRSYPEIGREFGMDHTTVLYGCKKIERLLLTDPDARREIEHVGFALGVMSP